MLRQFIHDHCLNTNCLHFCEIISFQLIWTRDLPGHVDMAGVLSFFSELFFAILHRDSLWLYFFCLRLRNKTEQVVLFPRLSLKLPVSVAELLTVQNFRSKIPL